MQVTLGDPNDLENSEDRRGAGGHGNQHVRLRRAQIGSKRSARLRWQSAAASRGRRPVLCSATIANASNFFRIEEMEIRSAIGEVCRICSRDPSPGEAMPALRASSESKYIVVASGPGPSGSVLQPILPPGSSIRISRWPPGAVLGWGPRSAVRSLSMHPMAGGM